MGKEINIKSNLFIALFLIIIFVISLFMRISGNDFGLPDEFMADESSPHVISAVRVLQVDNFMDLLKVNTGAYPRLYWYFLAIFFKIASVLNFPFNFPRIMTDATEWYPMMVFIRANAYTFFVVSRFSTAFFGALIPVVGYFLARRLFSLRAGILASVLTSFDFLLVKDSHYVYPDTIMALFIVLGCLFAVRYFDEKKTFDILLASFFAGLSVAIKYNGFFIFLPILLALILKTDWKAGFGKILRFFLILIACLAIFLGIFVFSNPLIVTDFKTFIEEFWNVSHMYAGGMLGKTGPFGYHLFAYRWTSTYEPLNVNTLIYDMNTVALIFGFVMAIYSFFARKIKVVLVSSFTILYYLFIDLQKIKETRQVIILVPLLIVLCSGLVFDVAGNKRKLKTALLSILIISSLFTLSRSIYLDFLLNQKDSRIYAAEWIRENIPAGSKIILYGSYTSGPPVDKPDYDREYYQYPYYNFNDAVKNDRAKPLQDFIADGVEYLILNSYDMDSHLCKSTQIYYPQTYASYKDFYDSIDKGARLIYVTDVNRSLHPGPVIKIYKLSGG
ncbi:MAG: glycosyltransferase family 39 protein [Actinobacteria bacterium]|nr:glycosyltransferase family 39 protein [Actinomycetota bacterium]